MTAPKGLNTGGRRLWRQITGEHELDAVQRVQLLEACRTKDHLDKLDELLRGELDAWARITDAPNEAGEVKVVINAALDKQMAAANLLKQLLAALRLPDSKTGKKPQQRSARGAYAPKKPTGGNVTAIDRARKRRQA